MLDSAGIRRGAWDAVLDNMKGFGLRISAEQRSTMARPAGFLDVTAAEVAARRAKPMTAAEVHSYRASLKK